MASIVLAQKSDASAVAAVEADFEQLDEAVFVEADVEQPLDEAVFVEADFEQLLDEAVFVEADFAQPEAEAVDVLQNFSITLATLALQQAPALAVTVAARFVHSTWQLALAVDALVVQALSSPTPPR